MSAIRRKCWILNSRPSGDVTEDDFEYREMPLRTLGNDEILVRNIYLSLDPTNRLWMSDIEQYLPPVQLGEVMRGGTAGVVEATTSPRFKIGDLVAPAAGEWASHTISSARGSRPIPANSGLPLDAFMSVLGMTGLTAYFGMLD
ncbi:MAG TPA: NADP-dependent oxidoreductase, partial [Stellaceae bacterium]|nr:NADP-dependent oxidoreductase [Stellaceae bacterium]